MRICVFSEYFFPYLGGGQVHLYELSRALSKLGCEMTVIANRMKGAKTSERIDGIEVHRVGVLGDVASKYRRGRYIMGSVRKAAELHRANSFDLIHSHVFAGSLAGLIAGKELGLRAVTTVHGLYSEILNELGQGPSLFSRQMERFIIRLPHSRIIAVSRATASQIEQLGVDPRKVEIIPNGVDLEKFNPNGPRAKLLWVRDGYRVSFFGRLWTVKGVEFLIKAVPEILRAFPDTRFFIAGTGPQEQELVELARSLKVSAQLTFHGPVNYFNVPKYLRASDCVVMPSLMEGFPITALEAIACEVPVVATRVGGTPELITDRKTGILVEPRSPRALAQGVVDLLSDARLRGRISRAGRKLVEKEYSWDAIAKQTYWVYRNLKRR